MIVLLHGRYSTFSFFCQRIIICLRRKFPHCAAYQNNFTALDVAIMFSFYEAAGVVTNLAAGLLGAKWGIKTTLVSGLSMQLVAFAMLFAWQNDWSKVEAIIYVTVSQVLSGVAKDLTKLGGKTVTKLVTPEGKNSSLFKLVSLITGWKNSLKGVGYFLGAATVSVSYYLALGILVGLILLAYPFAVFGLTNDLGRARKENVKFSQLFKYVCVIDTMDRKTGLI
jgi:MFS family permease